MMRPALVSFLCLGAAIPVQAQQALSLTADTARVVSQGGLHVGPSNFSSTNDLRILQGWNSRHDYPSWSLRVTKPGRARLGLVLANGDGFGGSKFVVRLGQIEIPGTVPATKGWRGREAFQLLDLGDVELREAGLLTVEIRALELPRQAVMSLKELVLVGEGVSPAEFAEETQTAADWPKSPGFGARTEGLHPGLSPPLDLTPPGSPRMRVTGLDRLPDGRLAVATWDAVGSVWLVNPAAPSVSGRFHRFADGLSEPTGLRVVNDQIYVLQRQQLTRLIDRDQNGLCEERECVSQAWPVSTHPDENTFGPLWRDGRFLIATGVAMSPAGITKSPQVGDRGCVLSVNPSDGSYEVVAAGNRSQNGLFLNNLGDLFLMDNQGDWMPCSSLFHVESGDFFGHRYEPRHPFSFKTPKAPVLRLPHFELSISPTEPVFLRDGPYAGQIVFGDIAFSGLLRASLEKVDGVWQGAAYRLTSGLAAPVNRLLVNPDGSLTTGGLAMPNLPGHGRRDDGLEQLSWSGQPFFDLRSSRVLADGLEVELTEPLREGLGWDAAAYRVTQWTYQPTADYGGPKLEEETLTVESASVSPDRLRIHLAVKGLRLGRTARLSLAPSAFTSASGHSLWTGDAYHTTHRFPPNQSVPRLSPPPGFTRFTAPVASPAASPGERLYASLCASCHRTDDVRLAGPGFRNLFGSKRLVQTGGVRREIVADENYLRNSILNPSADIAEGFQPLMPNLASNLSEPQVGELVTFLKSLSSKPLPAGWKSLFDGSTRAGWTSADPARPSLGWTVRDGSLNWAGQGSGDLALIEPFLDGELTFEIKLAQNGTASFGPENAPPITLTTGPELPPLQWHRIRVVTKDSKLSVYLGDSSKPFVIRDLPASPGRWLILDSGHPTSYRAFAVRNP